MKKELQEKLRSTFPDVWENVEISIGDGWFNLALDISHKLQIHNLQVEQIKEKFGLLRVYTTGTYNYEIYDYLQKVENISGTICENCGKEGKKSNVNGYWIKTLCGECKDVKYE